MRSQKSEARIKYTLALFVYRLFPFTAGSFTAILSVNFLIALFFLLFPSLAPSEFKVVSDARAIRLAQER